jgi:hypothetical protein
LRAAEVLRDVIALLTSYAEALERFEAGGEIVTAADLSRPVTTCPGPKIMGREGMM